MKRTSELKGKWSLALTGKLAQFNLSLLLILIAVVGLLWLTSNNADYLVRRGGVFIGILLLAMSVWGAYRFYSRQEPRPADGQSSSVELRGLSGQELIVKNPPDKFITDPQTQALIRSLLLGYDDKLCPDGKVVGNVADEQYAEYTETEREAFVSIHRDTIKGKKLQARMLLKEDPPC